jgi:hypothetical protein
VTVAILLAGGVLLGFLALVVDLGQIYAERSQLQAGADAAALAIGYACSGTPRSDLGPERDHHADCVDYSGLLDLAQKYADANASDGRSHVAQICGRMPGVLSDCGAPVGNLTDCLGAPPSGGYVQVRLSTETSDGQYVLPPTFAQAIGVGGADVAACARASWSSPADIPIVAMTMSTCEFDSDTNDGHDFGTAVDPEATDQRLINFWLHAYSEPCAPMQVSQAALLDGGGNTCTLDLPADATVHGEITEPVAGALLSPACESAIDTARTAGLNGNVVYIPVYDGTQSQFGDGNIQFHLRGLAPFLVTGYQLGPAPYWPGYADHRKPSTITGNDACSEPYERCVLGVFTGPLVALSDLTSGGDVVVRLVG